LLSAGAECRVQEDLVTSFYSSENAWPGPLLLAEFGQGKKPGPVIPKIAGSAGGDGWTTRAA